MKISLNDYTKEELEKAESILFNGNGFIGVRGNLEEWYYDFFATNRETYLNGFYETKEISYPEKMYGFTPTGETMVSVVDGQTTLIKIGGEDFRIDQGKMTDSKRYVDLEKGMTIREMTWTSPKGRVTRIKIFRLTSFIHKNLFAMKFDFERINHQEPIELITHLNFQPVKTIDKNDPRMSHDTHLLIINDVDFDKGICSFETANSRLKAAMHWSIKGKLIDQQQEADRIVIRTELEGNTYEKKLSYAFRETTHQGMNLSFEELAALQKNYLQKFWQTAEIKIKSKDRLEESVNYSTYALLQSLGTDGQTSIAAKGLSGSGYEGHYFWDTEMYVFPLFLHLKPELARQMLSYRINTLDKARENRRMFGYQTGALYPWRTISGTESSAFFEAGSAQHHINADIAYAFISYFRQTNDFSLMLDGGFAVLLETARVFNEIGYRKNGQFHIDKVTGPDEYSVLVNDNFYTNRMVEHQFIWVNKIAQEIKREFPEKWQELCQTLKISEEELTQMTENAQCMAKPIDKELGIIAQDRDFLNKEIWPLSKEETQYPLLMNYHPLMIYRYQVAKQADAVLALMLFQEDFSQETAIKTVEYYDQITTHDSTLSYSAFATVYSRLGNSAKGYQYFLENARVDLDNSHQNTKDGIHTASMGGTFLTIVYGFCNLSFTESGPVLEPHLPTEIEAIRFTTTFRGEKYAISVTHEHHEVKKISAKEV